MLVVAGVILLVANPFSKTVPDFLYMSVEEAEKEAQRHGFGIECEYTYSDTVAKDHIISQLPLAGEELDKHEKIRLSVSMGATGGKIEVPDFKGNTLEEAKKELEALRLICEVEFVNSAAESGTVIRQTPAEGTHMNPAGKVKLYVSSGPKETPSEATEEPEDENTDQNETKRTHEPAPKQTASASSKMYSVKIPDDAGENVHIKIVANGNVMHDSTHSKSEGKVVQEISGSGTVKVQTFIDGVLVNEESLSF